MEKLCSKIRAAIDKYSMIDEGDTVAVGISGGKDSLVLLECLCRIRQYYPKKFTLKAITCDPCFGGKETDLNEIGRLCERWGVEYIICRTSLAKIIFEERKEKNPCSLCAKMRRGILHKAAKENGCNKIALGHHFNDAVQTFVMNLFDCGNISCFSPKSYLSNRELWLIRPMIFCEENEIVRAANKYKLPVVKSECPDDGNTERKAVDTLIKELKVKYPDIEAKIMGAMQRGNISGWGL